jgi:hypothetical protein
MGPQARGASTLAAPSWSWTSVNGSWHHMRLPPNTRITVKAIQVEFHLVGPDPFNVTKVRKITLQGPFATVKIQYAPSNPQ